MDGRRATLTRSPLDGGAPARSAEPPATPPGANAATVTGGALVPTAWVTGPASTVPPATGSTPAPAPRGAGPSAPPLRPRGRPLVLPPLPDTAAVRQAWELLDPESASPPVQWAPTPPTEVAGSHLPSGPTGPEASGPTGLTGPEAAEPVDEAERLIIAQSHRCRVLIEWLAVLAGALLVALVIKVLLFQAFVIPSESMVPTLAVGDRVLVNKASYRVGEVGRGDLVVFERPADAGTGEDADLIKRVIGLPGETVRAAGGVLFVDNRALLEDYLPRSARTDDFGPVTLGPDELFMMGDNRQSSRDSRFFGPVPVDLVIGRAFLRVWPPAGLGRL